MAGSRRPSEMCCSFVRVFLTQVGVIDSTDPPQVD